MRHIRPYYMSMHHELHGENFNNQVVFAFFSKIPYLLLHSSIEMDENI